MKPPEQVLFCIDTLESAGFSAYAVGGCVRDSLLGLTPKDYDLCTDAKPADICQAFSGHKLVRNGEKHGTIGVIVDKQLFEITTFRTEGGYQDSRHPDWVQFVGDIKEDLARRDFTVNAIAYHPAKGYVDPFGGQADLQSKVLRTVGNPTARFQEDSLRILRGVRFAVCYHLLPEADTLQAMLQLTPTLDTLAKERVFTELCKLFPRITADDFVRYAPILTRVIPELAPTVNFQQHSPHHLYDVYTHTALVVERVPADLPLRWAAVLHDTGKPVCFYQDEDGRGHFPSHAKHSAQLAHQALTRLKAPTALREQVELLVAHHMTVLEPSRPLLRRRLGKFGPENLYALLQLQQADFCGKGVGDVEADTDFSQIKAVLDQLMQEQACLSVRSLAIDGHALLALGLTGKDIGACQNYLLQLVQEERLENTADALLSAAKQFQSGEKL